MRKSGTVRDARMYSLAMIIGKSGPGVKVLNAPVVIPVALVFDNDSQNDSPPRPTPAALGTEKALKG